MEARTMSKRETTTTPGARLPDHALVALFDRFGGRLISPGGAAAMLGVSRQRVHGLIEEGRLRCFRSEDEHEKWGPIKVGGTRWAYVPLDDVERVADEVGRHLRPVSDGREPPMRR
jgi:hypothetical protein